MLEHRPFRPFKTSEEYLYAMKEDLAEWLHTLYNLDINVDNFFEVLDPGVILCQHANKVNAMAAECRKNGVSCPKFPDWEVTYRTDVSHNAFHARDNVSNFIRWCRALGIMDCLLFETDDLVMRKNEKSFILCLLEVARRGSKVGMLAPLLVQMEEEIDRDIAKDQSKSGRGALEDRGTSPEPFFEETRVVDYGPMPQVTNNDLKSLDEMVSPSHTFFITPSSHPLSETRFLKPACLSQGLGYNPRQSNSDCVVDYELFNPLSATCSFLESLVSKPYGSSEPRFTIVTSARP